MKAALPLLGVVIATALNAGGHSTQLRISEARNSKGRIEKCLAFVEATKLFQIVLKGHRFHSGLSTTAVDVDQFDWIYGNTVRHSMAKMQIESFLIDRDVVSEFLESFGPVGTRSLLTNEPAYVDNKAFCLSVFEEFHE